MRAIHFNEYLRNFKPTQKKTAKDDGLILTRQNSGVDATLDTLEIWIQDLYKLIKSDLMRGDDFRRQMRVSDFHRKLENLRNKLVFYCEDIEVLTQDRLFSLQQTGQQLFSKFLQHLFTYVEEEVKDSIYVSKLMGEILTQYPSDFFYFLTRSGKEEVTLWVDPVNDETALIAMVRVAEHSILDQFIEVLKKAFYKKTSDFIFNPLMSSELEKYISHESEEGFSALSMAWRRDNPAVIDSLLELGSALYGDRESVGFRYFLFQIDKEGTTALMRATERGDLGLVRLLLERMKETYSRAESSELQEFLQYQDKVGLTALTVASRAGHYDIVKQLLETALLTFGSREGSGFQYFLMLTDYEGNSPFISAAKEGHRKILKLLFKTAEQAYGSHNPCLRQFILHQNDEGYTALMRAVEANQLTSVQSFLNLLVDLSFNLQDSFTILKNVFELKTEEGLSLLHIVVQNRSIKMLAFLLAALHQIFDKNSEEFIALSSIKDESGLTPFDRIAYDEMNFRAQLEQENRPTTLEEQVASSKRVEMAEEFFAYGVELFVQNPFLDLERSISHQSHLKTNFFSIFCSRSRHTKRSLTLSQCAFNEKDYQNSLPEEAGQIRKEALVNLISFLKQTDFDSIEQIVFIRKRHLVDPTEQEALENYRITVEQYYHRYGAEILSRLKGITAENLESAWLLNNLDDSPYTCVLVDNGNDLLLLSKAGIFSGALLNPIKSVALHPRLSNRHLKNWLDHYFGSEYTLHPFDPISVIHYPSPLKELKLPIVSSEQWLAKKIHGLSYKTIQALFLLEDALIQNTAFATENFFADYAQKLFFRVEQFHKIYFDLEVGEKLSLQRLFKQRIFSINTHFNPYILTEQEEIYLYFYGGQLIDLLSCSDPERPIELGSLFDIIVNSYEKFLEKDNSLSVSETKQLITALRQVKTRLLTTVDPHNKAWAQLTVFLLPSFIQAVANKDPLALSVPLSLLGSDLLLRELLIGFSKHPQALRIFNGVLGNKILRFINTLGERVPLIGSAFALYSLLESGKALAMTDEVDPNRPYYAHLLMNNLVSIGTMVVDASVTLPFWPVLGLFTLLTLDQIVTEGKRIHDNVLHLRDDQGHPLSKFYTELKLGLGIVSREIQLVEKERYLFQALLEYLVGIQNNRVLYPLIVIMLPEVQFIHMTGDQTQFIIKQKSRYEIALGEVEALCEREDPYYLTEHERRYYTLLTGTWVESASQGLKSSCTLGQAKIREGRAKTSEKAGIAVIINKQALKSTNQSYSLFVPIDPRHVSRCWISLHQHGEHYQRQDLSQSSDLLPCSGSAISHCIDTIIVAINSIYTLAATQDQTQTEIHIQDDALRNSLATGAGVEEIRYLIAYTDQVIIAANAIPKKTLVFLNANQLHFENESLKSENGFTAALQGTQVLVLEFDKTTYIGGTIPVNRNQTVVISHLKGVDQAKPAILNATEYHRFSVSLGQYTKFIYQQQQLIIRGPSSDALINVYAANGLLPLYYFMKPLNHLTLQATQTHGMSFSIDTLLQTTTTIIDLQLMASSQDKVLSQIFSGQYVIHDETFYSRIVMRKELDQPWECALEINASTSNSTVLPDLIEIQRQNFKKLSILTRQTSHLKLIHYFFYQDERKPSITGIFTEYQLKEDIEHWILFLKKQSEISEESQVFLSENTTEIVIQSIRYEINFQFSLLFAVDTCDHGPIDGIKVLAPIKVKAAFNETLIIRDKDLYIIGNISLINPTDKIKIHFNDTELPFSLLSYQSEMRNIPLLEGSSRYSHYREGKLQVASLPKIILGEKSESKRTNKNFVSGLLTTIAEIGAGLATLTGLGTLFIKRFRRPGSSAMIRGGITLSLLENQPVETLVIADENNRYREQTNNTFQFGSEIVNDSYVKINQQLVFGYWLGKQFKNTFFQKPKKMDNVSTTSKLDSTHSSSKFFQSVLESLHPEIYPIVNVFLEERPFI